jgi:hypothetical protein
MVFGKVEDTKICDRRIEPETSAAGLVAVIVNCAPALIHEMPNLYATIFCPKF